MKHVQQIELIKDEGKVLHKIQLILSSGQSVLIDLDEMELEEFFIPIDQFLNQHYNTLVKEVNKVV